ncbi:MAG: hypothetical protein AABZ84_08355 [Pseudomonadota bacterium]
MRQSSGNLNVSIKQRGNMFFMKLSGGRPARGLRLGVMIWCVMCGANNPVFASTPVAARAPGGVQSSTPVAQRLVYIESLLRSQTGLRLTASADPEVKQLLSQLRARLAKAKTAAQAGDTAQAEQWSREVMALLMEASRRLPSDDEDDRRAEQLRYQTLRQGIEVFQQAHQRNSSRLSAEEGKTAVVGFDTDTVAGWVRDGDRAALGGDYVTANAFLINAQQAITGALRGMLNHRTLVHELKIDTAEGEYHYELQRYQGYADLIPVAIDMRSPPPQTISEMLALMDKAQWMVQQAGLTAKQGDYPVAIRMVLDATDAVRTALRGAGVDM